MGNTQSQTDNKKDKELDLYKICTVYIFTGVIIVKYMCT